MDEPHWLSLELVLGVHDRQLLEHGGSRGVRDQTLLESALARFQQRWAYADPAPDLVRLAAAYACGISRNHPFVDGNKRTAAVACELFLELNGYVLVANDAALYPQFLGIAAGEIDEEECARWLRAHARPDQVSETPAGYATDPAPGGAR